MELNLVPFYPTYILYDPNDLISVACVQFSLFPIYVMVFYTSWFLVTREIQPVITVGGHLLGEIINSVLKHIVKQPRPVFHNGLGLSHGMPSAHSQFMGFFATYFSCLVLLQIPNSKCVKITIVVALIVSSLCVAFSRVYLMYHTTPQVVVGLVIGVVWGLSYTILSTIARDIGLVDWLLSWRIVRLFWIKDSYYHCYKSFREEYMRAEKDRLHLQTRVVE